MWEDETELIQEELDKKMITKKWLMGEEEMVNEMMIIRSQSKVFISYSQSSMIQKFVKPTIFLVHYIW